MAESEKVVYAAMFGNLAIAISKFAAAIFTGSSVMLAEGFHSSVDTGNELLLLLGIKRSKAPADRQHPFGHGKELYFWALIVALSMFGIGGGLSIYEGITSMLHPHSLEDPVWAYAVLGVATIFEGYSWMVSYKALKKRQRRGEPMMVTVRRSANPALFSPFVEDTAALAGIVVAFLGVWLSHALQRSYIDSAASVVIGLILVIAAGFLAAETGALLVGESVDQTRLDRIQRTIEEHDSVQRVGDLLTMQVGPEQVLLTANIEFRNGLDTDQLEQAVDEIEAAVQKKEPDVKRIFFEADGLRRSESRDAA